MKPEIKCELEKTAVSLLTLANQITTNGTPGDEISKIVNAAVLCVQALEMDKFSK